MNAAAKDGRKIGLYGGSFDPVHFGHLRTALEVLQTLKLDELRFVPSGNPPHRSRSRVSAAHRLNMLSIAIADTPGMVIDPREVHSAQTSYTIDTLESMAAQQADCRLTLVIGMDQFSVFDTWHRWQDLLQQFDLAVMERPGETISAVAQEMVALQKQEGSHGGRINIIPVTQLQISSSRIRDDLQNHREIQFLSPRAVRDYIREHRLYTDAAG